MILKVFSVYRPTELDYIKSCCRNGRDSPRRCRRKDHSIIFTRWRRRVSSSITWLRRLESSIVHSVLGGVPYIYPFPPGDLGSNLTSGSLGPRESDPNGISRSVPTFLQGYLVCLKHTNTRCVSTSIPHQLPSSTAVLTMQPKNNSELAVRNRLLYVWASKV